MPQTLTAADLERFHGGSEHIYRHPLYSPLVYTEGVRHVAEAGEAHWLLDIIATESRVEPLALHPQLVWTLTVHDRPRALLTCTDGGEERETERELVRRPIALTDFPLDQVVIWVIGGVIMLPQEY